MTRWLTAQDVIDLGWSRSTLFRRLPGLITRGRGKNREICLSSLPADLQAKYAHVRTGAATTPASAEDQRRLARISPELRAAYAREASRRAALIERFEAVPQKTITTAGQREPSPAVREILAAWPTTDPALLQVRPSWGRPCDPRTLHNSLRRLRSLGVIGLVPHHPPPAPGDARLRPIHGEVQRALCALRLVEYPDASVESIYRHLVDRFAGTIHLPCLRVVRDFLADRIPRGVHVYHRYGARTFDSTVATPILRRYDDLDVGQWWSGDHHMFDTFVINPSRGGQLDRPWLTAWLDVRSRALVGWAISLQPSSRTIADAFVHGVRPKRDPVFNHLCGRPDHVYVDNGKDFRAHVLEGNRPAEGLSLPGLFGAVGTRVVHAVPYNAKAKIVERFFRTVADQFSRDLPTYCGRSPGDRTERHRELLAGHEQWLRKTPGVETAFLAIDDFRARFAGWVVRYLSAEHDGLTEHGTGRRFAPRDVAARRARGPILIDELALAVLAMRRDVRTVRKGLISIEDRHYHHDALCGHEGKRVECRWDPARPEELFVLAIPGGALICRAGNLEFARYAARGVDTGEILTEALRRRKAERKAVAGWLRVQERRLLGSSIEEAVAAEIGPRTVPAPTPAAPSGAVEQIQPGVREIVREIRDRARRPATQPPADPPAATVLIDDDQAHVESLLGSRPAEPEFFYGDLARQRWLRTVADWDRRAGEIRRTRDLQCIEATNAPSEVASP